MLSLVLQSAITGSSDVGDSLGFPYRHMCLPSLVICTIAIYSKISNMFK